MAKLVSYHMFSDNEEKLLKKQNSIPKLIWRVAFIFLAIFIYITTYNFFKNGSKKETDITNKTLPLSKLKVVKLLQYDIKTITNNSTENNTRIIIITPTYYRKERLPDMIRFDYIINLLIFFTKIKHFLIKIQYL